MHFYFIIYMVIYLIIILIYLIPEPDAQVGDFQRKLEILNNGMTNDRQFRQVQQLGNCKFLFYPF